MVMKLFSYEDLMFVIWLIDAWNTNGWWKPTSSAIIFYHIVRFKREEAKILARENREKAKAEAEIWRAEVNPKP